MSKKEKPAAIIMTDGKREIIRQLLSEYDIQRACENFSVNRNTKGVKSTSSWLFTEFFSTLKKIPRRVTGDQLVDKTRLRITEGGLLPLFFNNKSR